MLYFFFGKDKSALRRTKDQTVEACVKKNPQADRVQYSDVDFSMDGIVPLISDTNLFGTKSIVELYNIFDNDAYAAFVLENIQAFQASTNQFMFIENALTADIVKRIEKAGATISRFDAKAIAKKEYTSFALSDAVAHRNKKESWILYAEAMERGLAFEEILGTLFWQMKTLSLVKTAAKPDAATLGINPFVFKKSLSAASRFTEEEIAQSLARLVGIYHESHRGTLDGQVALEQFILEKVA